VDQVKALRAQDPELLHRRLIDHLGAGMQRTLGALKTIQTGDF
jgi:hypothetical protein